MRFIHTSDWHIGQRLYNNDRYSEFELYFDWLSNRIHDSKAQCLLVCGDIFDLSNPSNISLEQYYKALWKLKSVGLKKIIIIGGNHDSVLTLNAPAEILKHLDIHIIGNVKESIQEQIINIYNSDNQLIAVVAAIPFLRERDLRKQVAGESFEEKIEASKKAMANHYAQMAEFIGKINVPIITTGHFMLSGSMQSDSERQIFVGNLSGIDIENFPEFYDYFALGHIHRHQNIQGKNHVAYSGSPLPLSFSERSDPKFHIEFDVNQNQIENITPIEVPKFRNLLKFEGSLNEIITQVNKYQNDLPLETWAEIHVVEKEYIPLIRNDIDNFIESVSNLKILKYTYNFENQSETTTEAFTKNLTDLLPENVFRAHISKLNVVGEEDLMSTFLELCQQVAENHEDS